MNQLSSQAKEPNTFKNSKKASDSIGESFLCEHCMKYFDSAFTLKAHLLNEFELDDDSIAFFNMETRINENSESPTSADTHECEKIFKKSEKVLLNCPNCNKIFKGQKGLNQHLGKIHNRKKRNSICKKCGKTFKHKYALKFHIRQVHDEATRVLCTFCGKEIYNKYMLAKHVSEKHYILN
ncbi:unnamed protein product [Blepharisma stoltei]|uniref:C2H2-type domain-containing protein n=1 Tax=Blepharisma stoltei TaxID=1481888 RepID=A0AAU9JIU4_9CILI|nr:unnamed protein product [Blepharisma stoltei]